MPAGFSPVLCVIFAFSVLLFGENLALSTKLGAEQPTTFTFHEHVNVHDYDQSNRERCVFLVRVGVDVDVPVNVVVIGFYWVAALPARSLR